MTAGFDKIDEFKSDVLREIGNIGSGNAASSLAAMLDEKVEISVPSVKMVDVNEAANMLGGVENIAVGIFAEIGGDINGFILLIANMDMADRLLHFVNETTQKDGNFTEMQLSALSELGNIMASAYASSISNMLQMEIRTSVPHMCIDMVGAILSIPSIELSDVSDKIVFIENHFINSNLDGSADIFLIPDADSFNKIMQSLGL